MYAYYAVVSSWSSGTWYFFSAVCKGSKNWRRQKSDPIIQRLCMVDWNNAWLTWATVSLYKLTAIRRGLLSPGGLPETKVCNRYRSRKHQPLSQSSLATSTWRQGELNRMISQQTTQWCVYGVAEQAARGGNLFYIMVKLSILLVQWNWAHHEILVAVRVNFLIIFLFNYICYRQLRNSS